MEAPKLSEEEMQLIYNWVDEIPLSRPKKNIARDFSDGGKTQIDWFFSVGSRNSEAFRASLSGAPQLQRCTFSIAERVQLEHFEPEVVQEGRIHFD